MVAPFKLYYLYSGVNSDSMNLILVIVENVEKMHDWLGNVDVCSAILAAYIFHMTLTIELPYMLILVLDAVVVTNTLLSNNRQSMMSLWAWLELAFSDIWRISL